MQRRGVLVSAYIVVLAACACSIAPSCSLAATEQSHGGVWSFVSNPSLHPPAISHHLLGSEDLFVAPYPNYGSHERFVGSSGPEIIAASGQIIWEYPLSGYGAAMDFHAATYNGQPVLVWWQGEASPKGTGGGDWKIANQHYEIIATVAAPPGWTTDLHDFQITPQGDAYFLAEKDAAINLKHYGGATKGSIVDNAVFEVNIATQQVVWQWDALQHIPLWASYWKLRGDGNWDVYHFNSIDVLPSGELLLSARNTWAAYWVSEASGVITSVLGGKQSSFKMERSANFAWQHDARVLRPGEVSLFDDEATPSESKQSRGLVLSLNYKSHIATVRHQYFLRKPELTASQGNMQTLPDGNVFIDWGQLPDYSEYNSNSRQLLQGSLPGADQSYRGFISAWTGDPTEPPRLKIQGNDAYISWNGATQAQAWQLLEGAQPTTLQPTGPDITKTGFETVFTARGRGPYYAVNALGSKGEILGTSAAAQRE